MAWYRGRVARLSSAKAPTAVRICSVPHPVQAYGRTGFFMLTKEEEAFINYWSVERLKKKKFLRNFSIGLPLALVIVAGSLISLFSGWYKKADMALHMDGSVIIVILIACIAIVIFITLFSAHHKWDQNELHYGELMVRKEHEAMQQPGENNGLPN